MSEKAESSGYKGEALNALKKAGCEVGDIIRLSGDGKVYEGILIPRSETGDGKHIVVKLKSGYNIGVRVTPNIKIEKVGKRKQTLFCRACTAPAKARTAKSCHNEHRRNHSQPRRLPHRRRKVRTISQRLIRRGPRTQRHRAGRHADNFQSFQRKHNAQTLDRNSSGSRRVIYRRE